MFYEVFEEIRKGNFTHQQLVNKCVIDSLYRPKSQIQDIYDTANDQKTLLENSYPYIIYQKILMGISTAIFFGLDPYNWKTNIFFDNCRMSVPDSPLDLYLTHPCLMFEGKDNFSYQNSCLAKWDSELQKISASLKDITGVSISQEGFRAHTYRMLENLMGLRALSPKRTSWVEFLHDLLILDKTFSYEELKEKKLSIRQLENGRFLVEDPHFVSKDFLEFNFMKKLDHLNTKNICQAVDASQDAFDHYSTLNEAIMGRIPLSHFYVGQHMFVGKEEFDFNNYYDFFIKPWGIKGELTIHYLNNPKGERDSCLIADFPAKLKKLNYIIVLGVTEKDRGTVDAQARMIKG